LDFTSVAFLGFLAALALLYRLAPRAWRCPLLVAASYYFYWISAHWFVLLLLAATLAAFFAARSKSFLLTIVGLLIATLVLFKALPLRETGWLIPLGVSYYTFKLAGYLIDTHWGVIEPERRLLAFLAYPAFFPQIGAGPIQRPETFLPQAERASPVPFSTLVTGVLRILLGFFKKFVIADSLGRIVNYVYGHLTSNPGAPVLFGFYGYPLQLYADFSGLTDIAVGASILFGIEAPENFNAPFSAATPTDYWRRWHITLTQWLTDYVFTPLRMSLRSFGNSGLVFSLFVNMILIALWHGFRWTFVLFGVVHALYLSMDALTQRTRKRWYKNHRLANRITDWVGPLVTFHLITIAFVFFRANSVAAVWAVFTHLFDGLGAFSEAFRDVLDHSVHSLFLLAGAWLMMECADALRRRFWLQPLLINMPRWGRWSVYSCTAVSVLFTVFLLLTSGQKSSPFLYAIF
jgi:alginate O-acetyltransferase complex protein AlgI